MPTTFLSQGHLCGSLIVSPVRWQSEGSVAARIEGLDARPKLCSPRRVVTDSVFWRPQQYSRWRAEVNPSLERFDLVGGPRAVTRHSAVSQTSQYRARMRRHVVVVPQVKSEPHRVTIVFTEHVLDVLLEANGSALWLCPHERDKSRPRLVLSTVPFVRRHGLLPVDVPSFVTAVEPEAGASCERALKGPEG